MYSVILSFFSHVIKERCRIDECYADGTGAELSRPNLQSPSITGVRVPGLVLCLGVNSVGRIVIELSRFNRCSKILTMTNTDIAKYEEE